MPDYQRAILNGSINVSGMASVKLQVDGRNPAPADRRLIPLFV